MKSLRRMKAVFRSWCTSAWLQLLKDKDICTNSRCLPHVHFFSHARGERPHPKEFLCVLTSTRHKLSPTKDWISVIYAEERNIKWVILPTSSGGTPPSWSPPPPSKKSEAQAGPARPGNSLLASRRTTAGWAEEKFNKSLVVKILIILLYLKAKIYNKSLQICVRP